jgi:dihydrolipoamide dehydrogenase
MDYRLIPGVIYSNPEAAFIGDSEESAAARGQEAVAVTVSMRLSGRFVIENEGGDGICKIIATKKDKKIIGCHAVGNPVSELIFGASLAMAHSMTVADLEKTVFPHPTVSEIFREMARRLA